MSGSLSGIGKRRAAAKKDGGSDYAAKRQELVKAAAEVFRKKGFAAATLNDIATAFGTDRASLYYYVSSKEELFQACIVDTVVVNLQRAEAIVSRDIPPRDKLRELIAMLINSQVEHWPYMYVFMQEDMARVASIEAEWAQQMVKNTHKLEGYFMDIIAEGIERGQFRSDLSKTLIANALFGMTQWTHRWFVPGTSRYTADDLIRTFSAVLFEGIDAPSAKPGLGSEATAKSATSS